MSTLVVLPPVELHKLDLDRAIHLSEKRFASHGSVTLAAPAESIAWFKEQLGLREVILFDVAESRALFKIFIFVEGYLGQVSPPGPHSFPLTESADQRAYWLMLFARFKLVQPKVYDEHEFPYLNSHVFQRLSGRKHEFVNFPYGPLYSDVEVGPVNEFGFRIPPDYRKYAIRPAEQKLVAVFGGSAAFSFYCHPEEMFSKRLEEKLNASLSIKGSKYSFTVLNFGMHDNVVMQQMLTYMLFVHELKPDFVIAHDGHNDIYYGMQGDPFLLNSYEIIYQRYSEEWSKILHNSKTVPTPELYSMSLDTQQLNLPENVIGAYMKRKRQFEHIVCSDGGLFIWGVQPLHCSKSKLSPRELLRYRQAERGKPHSPELIKFLRFLYYAYGMMSSELARQLDIHLVDFNRLFQRYDDDYELLWDHCHTSPLGDEIIANQYHEKILSLMHSHL
jgi:hypothetical protein